MVPVCFLYLHWFISLPLSLSLYFSGCCSHSDYIAFSVTFLFQVCTFLFQIEIKIRYSRNPKDARYAFLKRHCFNVWYWGCTVSVWCHRQKWGGRAGRAFKTSFKKMFTKPSRCDDRLMVKWEVKPFCSWVCLQVLQTCLHALGLPGLGLPALLAHSLGLRAHLLPTVSRCLCTHWKCTSKGYWNELPKNPVFGTGSSTLSHINSGVSGSSASPHLCPARTVLSKFSQYW